VATSITLARPYAKAIFQLALESKTLNSWAELLEWWAALIKNPMVLHLLANQCNTPQEATQLLENLSQDPLDDTKKNLLKILVTRKRLRILPQINNLYQEFRMNFEKIQVITLTTATQLEETQKIFFIKKLQERFKRDINLTCVVKPDILGGFIVKAGHFKIDGSVKGQLFRLIDNLVS